MFSMTTIESSTTRPMATVIAPRVRMFSENPATCRPMKVTASDTGIDTADTRVERTEARKTRITTRANSRPSPPSVARPLIDSSMNGAWSKTTVTVLPSPRAARTWGSRSATSELMSTTLPSGVLVSPTDSAGWPSTREYDVAGAAPSSTSATAPRVVTAPRAPTSGTARRSSTEVSRDPACTDSVCSPEVSVPAGSTTPLSWSTVVTAAGDTPVAASAAGSSVIVIRGSAAPVTVTSRTPSTPSNSGTTPLAIRSASVAASAGEAIASCRTGRSASDPANTSGSTSSGRPAATRLIAVCRELVARSRSVPYSSSTVSVARPVLAVEVVERTPSTVATACSSGSTTRRSTTSGEAPGWLATTAATGISRDGISSCFSEPAETKPNTRTAMVARATRARLRRDRTARRDTLPPRPVGRCRGTLPDAKYRWGATVPGRRRHVGGGGAGGPASPARRGGGRPAAGRGDQRARHAASAGPAPGDAAHRAAAPLPHRPGGGRPGHPGPGERPAPGLPRDDDRDRRPARPGRDGGPGTGHPGRPRPGDLPHRRRSAGGARAAGLPRGDRRRRPHRAHRRGAGRPAHRAAGGAPGAPGPGCPVLIPGGRLSRGSPGR